MQHMSAAIGRTPDANARGVDFWSEGDPGDGVAIVLMLFGGNKLSPRLPFRISLVAIVEDQGDKDRRDKPLSERIKVHLFDSAKTVGHDDSRPPLAALHIIREIEPTGAAQPLTEKGNVASHRDTSWQEYNRGNWSPVLSNTLLQYLQREDRPPASPTLSKRGSSVPSGAGSAHPES